MEVKVLSLQQRKILWLVAVIVLALDQWSKYFMRSHPAPVDLGIITLQLLQNTGTLWGSFKGYNIVFLIISLVVLAGLIILAGHFVTNKASAVAVGFIVGGAMGNIIDRIAFGHVIDFIDVHFWPVFNVADSAITIGVIFLALHILLKDIPRNQKK